MIIWYFIGIFVFSAGFNVETRSHQNPFHRPRSAFSRGIWTTLGGISGVALTGLFIRAFFVFHWWVALLGLLAASVIGVVLSIKVESMAAAPAISFFLMIIGLMLSVIGFLNPNLMVFK